MDLRRRLDGWSEAGFDDSGWDGAALADHGYANLVASPAPPVRAVQDLRPAAVRSVARGQVFDLGQNINGWVRVRNLGLGAGTEITLTHGEAIDGTTATSRPKHLEVDLPIHPSSLFPRVRSTGSCRPGRARGDLRAAPHHARVPVRPRRGPSGVAERRRSYGRRGPHRHDPHGLVSTCSDERINRLHEAAVWSMRGNACDVPDRLPDARGAPSWTGDRQNFVPTAAFLYDVAGDSPKGQRDLAAEPWSSGLVANLAPSPPSESEGGFLAALNGSAGWGDAAVIVPWEIYCAYGDARVLEEQWPSMVAWLSYVERAAAGARHPERAARRPEPLPHERYLWDSGFHWGEWLVPGEDLKGADEFEAFRRSDKADVATAYFAHSARLMSRIAEVIGRDGDAGRYGELADQVRAAWQQAEFIDADGPG